MSAVPLGPRHDSSVCGKCRKSFKPGDRVLVAHIVVKCGFNPANRETGAWLSEEFELVHVMCENPSLEGQIITPSGT